MPASGSSGWCRIAGCSCSSSETEPVGAAAVKYEELGPYGLAGGRSEQSMQVQSELDDGRVWRLGSIECRFSR